MIEAKGKSLDGNRSGNSEEYDGFLWEYLLEKAHPELLEDDEFRVRNQSALLLKSIIGSDRSGKGVQNFDKVKNLILKNI